mmetsp:Transcript_17234/g.36013  ORF Transcript_17234/g.36013 Transcript_17234/m.36013 type:complete len:1430 (-) Transcript_17234:1765-6054(-)
MTPFALPSLAPWLALFVLALAQRATLHVRAELFSAPILKWSLQLEGSGRLSGRGLREGNAIVAHRDGTRIVATADDGSLHVIRTTNPIKTLGVHVPVEIVGTRTVCRSGATLVDAEQLEYENYGDSNSDYDNPNTNTNTNSDVSNANDFIVYAVVDTTIVPDVGLLQAEIVQSLGRNADKKGNDKNDNKNDNDANTDSDNDSSTVATNANTNSRADAVTSRVIAVDLNGAFLWSVQLPGAVEGTPIVGKHGIYVTHNDNGTGHLSVLRVQGNRNDGTDAAVVVATIAPPATEPGGVVPLGPPSLRTPAQHEGDYDDYYGGADNYGNEHDLVIVAENWESGVSSTRGGLYMLATTTGTAKGRADDASLFATTAATSSSHNYELVKISSWSYSASAPPVVRGDSIYLGAAAGTIAGFTGDRKNDLSGITSEREKEISPGWTYQVAPDPRNQFQPVRSQPLLDSGGDYMVVPGLNTDVYCIQTDNGRQLWRDDEGSQVLAKPVLFEGDSWRKVVYVVETRNGRVRQYDLYTGRRYWDYSCADISNQLCQDAVEADFAITPSGNTLYYGDIYGRINSLEVASFATAVPTVAPSPGPTERTTGRPAGAPSPPPVVAVSTGTPFAASTGTEEPVDGSVPVLPDGAAGTSPDGVGDDDEGNTSNSNNNNNNNSNVEPQRQQDQGDGDGVGDQENNNEEPNTIIDQQSAKKQDSKNLAGIIGAAMTALCLLMVPIVLLSLLRKRRNKPADGKEMALEIIDDCSSGDLGSEDDDEDDDDRHRLGTNETNGGLDPYNNNGDGFEVEMKRQTAPTQRTPTKKKKRKKRKNGLSDTPNTVNTLESIEEAPEEASAMVVVGEEYDVEDPSVEAVNLRRVFDNVVVDNGAAPAPGEVHTVTGSNHLEISVGTMETNSPGFTSGGSAPPPPPGDSNFLIDDDVPPPPPPPAERSVPASSSKQWTWGSLLQIGTSQSSKKANTPPEMWAKKPAEKLELKKASGDVLPAKEESSLLEQPLGAVPPATEESIPGRESNSAGAQPRLQKAAARPISKSKWKRKSKNEPSPVSSGSDSELIGRAVTPVTPNENENGTNEILFVSDGAIAQASPEQPSPDRPIFQVPYITEVPKDEEPLPNNVSEANKESEEPRIRSQTPIPPPQEQTPASPPSYSMLSGDVANLPSGASVRSIQQSLFGGSSNRPSSSAGGTDSDDESLYTSYTGGTRGTRETKEQKELSPVSPFYEQEIRRGDRSDFANERKGMLDQPDLSKNGARDKSKRHFLEEEDHPDDESAAAPGIQYMAHVSEKTRGLKYGKSARSKRDTTAFTSTNSSTGNKTGHTPLAQMYDQLAAIGQQKREEKKPAFKRRSKRMERASSPPPQQQRFNPEDALSQSPPGDAWNSFMSELAETEKQFFSPSASKRLLSDGNSSDNSEDTEIARINNQYNY